MFAEPDPDASAGQVSLSFIEEINHRVVNQFAEAISALSHDAVRAPGRQARLSLERAAERLHRHAALHRTLLRPAITDKLNLADYLSRICNAFSRAVIADGKVRILMKADDVYLSADRCWRVGLIVAELVRNALRHGLRGKAGLILVELEVRSHGVVCLVCDSGGAVAKPVPGRGQHLIRSIATELGGTVDWAFTGASSIARLYFPTAEGPQVTFDE